MSTELFSWILRQFTIDFSCIAPGVVPSWAKSVTPKFTLTISAAPYSMSPAAGCTELGTFSSSVALLTGTAQVRDDIFRTPSLTGIIKASPHGRPAIRMNKYGWGVLTTYTSLERRSSVLPLCPFFNPCIHLWGNGVMPRQRLWRCAWTKALLIVAATCRRVSSPEPSQLGLISWDLWATTAPHTSPPIASRRLFALASGVTWAPQSTWAFPPRPGACCSSRSISTTRGRAAESLSRKAGYFPRTVESASMKVTAPLGRSSTPPSASVFSDFGGNGDALHADLSRIDRDHPSSASCVAQNYGSTVTPHLCNLETFSNLLITPLAALVQAFRAFLVPVQCRFTEHSR